jgi:hypothetical protein
VNVGAVYRPGVDSVEAFFVTSFGSPLPVRGVSVGWEDMSLCQQGVESCRIKRCICSGQLMNVDGGLLHCIGSCWDTGVFTGTCYVNTAKGREGRGA